MQDLQLSSGGTSAVGKYIPGQFMLAISIRSPQLRKREPRSSLRVQRHTFAQRRGRSHVQLGHPNVSLDCFQMRLDWRIYLHPLR
jgi:hypothetical protein